LIKPYWINHSLNYFFKGEIAYCVKPHKVSYNMQSDSNSSLLFNFFFHMQESSLAREIRNWNINVTKKEKKKSERQIEKIEVISNKQCQRF
jgi:hypothetical protein